MSTAPDPVSAPSAARTQDLAALFSREFGAAPAGIWQAPGRVNLIGEHTDYNEGFVLPFAIDRTARVAVGVRTDRTIRLLSTYGDQGVVRTSLDSLEPGSAKGWTKYPLGVMWALRGRGIDVPGIDLLLDSNVPLGAGLSSSHAIECAVITALNDLTGIWTSCFMLMFLVAAVSLVWMHASIRVMERNVAGEALARLPELPEMQEIHRPEHVGKLSGKVLEDWRPEDKAFWEQTGRKIAARNLAISIPALLLSFAVWMVWSVVVAKLPSIGFRYTTDQLFWLASLPGVTGATLRIFYSFTVPIFGGRLWTTLATWSLMIPAVGIGYAVQNPATPYWIFLVLALLCGFGGGNFASSMSNISFFFPKAEKGNALALNAGLGNLGVSVVQFVVPMVITAGVFGWLGGDPQVVKDAGGGKMWLQNAGFIWVPFIAASAFAAWFGMNDIASAKASFAEQSVIFQRRHNWVMCWLYTGTFGSFIGYSAGFPLLAKTQFPEINALQYAFLGPLLGALSRSLTGWVADRWGGGRVTFWVFVVMALGALGVVHFLEEKNFAGFFAMFLLLFLASGVGNASTFQMIPAIMRKDMDRLMAGASADARRVQSDKESAAIIGFTSAIAAYGAFFIPKSFGSSIALTGGASFALYGFLAFYLSCIAITWFFYTRRGGLLFDIERGRTSTPMPAAGSVR